MPSLPRRPRLRHPGLTAALSIATIGTFAAAPARAQIGGTLGFNVFVFENFTAANTETNGRLAVGGNAILANYGVGTTPVSPANAFSLYVGGTLTAANVGINSGRAYAGAVVGGVGFNAPAQGPLVVGGAPLAAALAAEQTRLTSLSAALGAIGNTAGANVAQGGGNTWTFTGSGAGLQVFNVDAGAFGGACTVNVNIAAGATAVINVSGASATTTTCGMFINGQGANGDATTADAGRVLWNYHQATTLAFGGSVIGSVLAPGATITAGDAQLVGDLVVKAGTSTTEYYVRPFGGALPLLVTTPEPGTVALVAAGVAALAAAARRRRA